MPVPNKIENDHDLGFRTPAPQQKWKKKTPMLHTYLTAHADNVSNTTQISHNTATRIYRDKSCADDTPLCEGSGAIN